MCNCSGNEVVVGGSYIKDVEDRNVDADLSRELEAMARQLHPGMKVNRPSVILSLQFLPSLLIS